MTLTTRKLTGKPPWPMVLLAGPEKVGKTWAAVEASMSPLVSGCLWFPVGENNPDEYALIPGFKQERFDLVEHDGTYRGLLAQLAAALADEAKRKGKPRIWVLDSGTRLWDLLSGMAQREMYERLARKAAAQKRPVPDVEQKPSMDLWNIAADRWGHVVDALRAHSGPVLITARMELRTVVNDKGEPTKDREQKIQAQKSLPYDVDAVVEMLARDETVLTGVRSVKLASLDPRVRFNDFKVDTLWRRLGLDEGAGERSHSGLDPDDRPAQEADQARAELRALAEENGWDLPSVAAEYAAYADGAQLKDATNAAAIRTFTTGLAERWKKDAA